MATQDLNTSEKRAALPTLGSHFPNSWALGIYRLDECAGPLSLREHVLRLSAQVDALASICSTDELGALDKDLRGAIQGCLSDRATELRALIDAAVDMEALAHAQTRGGSHD